MNPRLPFAGAKILIVDDSEDIQLIFRFIFEEQGAVVVTAANGAEGISLAASESPSLILMDMQLPDTNGTEAMLRIRESGYRGAVIAVTARYNEQEKCRDAGFDDYLSKPVECETLVEMVTKHLH